MDAIKKNLITFAVSALLVLNAHAGMAPSTIKGDTGTALDAGSLIVPNKQATKASGGTRVETGNSDILANGSFEHKDPATGWTVSPASPSLELSDVPDGKRAVCFSPSSQAFEVSQDSTLNATAFADGTIQGLAKGRIKVTGLTAGQTIKFAPRKAGAIISELEKTVQATGKWEEFETPFFLGGTSNGISFHSSGYGNITATKICVDAMKVETNVKIMTNTGVVSNWQSYTPTFTGLGTPTGVEFLWRQVGQNMEIRGKFVAGTTTATEARISLPTNFTSAGTSIIPSLSIIGKGSKSGTTTTYFGGLTALIEPSVAYMTLGAESSSLDGITKANGSSIITSGQTVSFFASVPIAQFYASNSDYVSQNGNTSWSNCQHTSADFQGFGTVSNIETNCKRDGDDLLMRGKFTVGAPTAVEARLNLRLNGNSLTSAGTGRIPSIQIAGNGGRSVTAGTEYHVMLIEPSVGYVTFGFSNGTTAPLTKMNGSSMISTGQTFSFTARIPINGWENSNQIIGSFKYIPTTFGTSGVDLQFVFFGGSGDCTANCTAGSCVVCRQVGGKISGVTRASAGEYRINGIDGTKYTCFGTGSGSNYQAIVPYIGGSTSAYAAVYSGVSTAKADSSSNSVYCIGIP